MRQKFLFLALAALIGLLSGVVVISPASAGGGHGTNVTPATPVVNSAVCTDKTAGQTVWETVTKPPNGNGVTYSQSESNHVVTVTATPGKDVKLVAGNGWTLKQDGTAKWTYTLKSKKCDTKVTPATPTVNPAQCTDNTSGQAVWETVTKPANANGVSYSQSESNHVVTIIATPGAGVVLVAGNGWTLKQDGTAKWTYTLKSKKCDTKVTPAMPTVNPAQCADNTSGQTVWETVTKPANANGVSYSQSESNHVVTIIATPGAGVVLVAGNGWTLKQDGTAKWTYTLKSKKCDTKVTPATPTVNPAECTDDTAGQIVWETVTTPADADGITYAQSESEHVVTIVATPGEGTALAPAEGWTSNEDGTATWTHELQSKQCDEVQPPEVATPGTPVVVPAQCTDLTTGQTVWDTVIKPANTEQISYTQSEADHVVTIVATPAAEVSLNPAEGWTSMEDGTATWTYTLQSIQCGEVSPPGEGPPANNPKPPKVKIPRALPSTGAPESTNLAGVLGLMLFASGVVLVRVGRRRFDS
jgi:LPXTG-motif cell wall-anchored protein